MFVSGVNKSGYTTSNGRLIEPTSKIMTRCLDALRRLLWLALAAGGMVWAMEARSGQAAEAPVPNLATTDSGATSNHTARLEPGPDDGRIAYMVAFVLETSQYSHHPLDKEFSEKFFDQYVDMLDPQHLHFLQSDLAEFDHYRANLDRLTLATNHVANTKPAYDIFNRFLERLEQRINYATDLLKTDKFAFDTDEQIAIDRRDAPFPQSLDEARQLWRQRLRYDYLQEKLGRVATKKKADAAAKTDTAKENDNTVKSAQPAGQTKPKTEAEEIVDTLTRRYHRNLRLFQEWDHPDVMQAYLTALAHVYDPHSDYFNASQTENFSISMSLSLFGIGAVLTTDLDGYCKIQELKPGPAMKSKQLHAGDRIVAVAQGDDTPVDVVDMKLDKVVALIRGPKDTEVRLTVMPANSSERKVVSLVRDEIKLEDQEAKATILDWPNGNGKTLRLGIIDLPSFYASFSGLLASAAAETPKSTTTDVAKLLAKFQQEKVDGVILDLRHNGGGSLEEAIKLTGLFIKQGPVVQVAAGDESPPQVDRDLNPALQYDGPLIVLTSRFTASASEIVAGALQDYGRALIVGDKSTHGKGTVQNLTPLRQLMRRPNLTGTNDPGSLKMTIRKFYRPSGASTQLKGVLPDIVLPTPRNYSTDIGESALDNPMPWDTIGSVKYDHLNRVEPHLAELLKRSGDRVATNQDFAYIRQDIELYKKNQADKTISLNEQRRLKEMEEADARQTARDNELMSRKEPEEKVHTLTVRQADEPGLPPPAGKTNAAMAKASAGSGAAQVVGGSSASVGASANIPAPIISSTAADSEDEKWSADTAELEETERILGDYISLMRQKGLVTADR